MQKLRCSDQKRLAVRHLREDAEAFGEVAEFGSAAAALIYQHRRSDRQQAVAAALNRLAEDKLSRERTGRKPIAEKPTGTQRARDPQPDARKPQ
jgi:hypothetical protein